MHKEPKRRKTGSWRLLSKGKMFDAINVQGRFEEGALSNLNIQWSYHLGRNKIAAVSLLLKAETVKLSPFTRRKEQISCVVFPPWERVNGSKNAVTLFLFFLSKWLSMKIQQPLSPSLWKKEKFSWCPLSFMKSFCYGLEEEICVYMVSHFISVIDQQNGSLKNRGPFLSW